VSTQNHLARLLQAAVEGRTEAAHEALSPLLEYDSTHAGDLFRTLTSYLQHGCNATRCAESLYLHRSGLLYRLGRIEDLLGVRLGEFEDRVALEIAVLAANGR
jgi:purine catabolism regulator